jgi:hypothetical protein
LGKFINGHCQSGTSPAQAGTGYQSVTIRKQFLHSG